MLLGMAVLLVFQCLGEGVVFVFKLPLPGPVAGMLLLFAALLLSPRLLAALEETAAGLLGHLSLLFVPAGAGIVVTASGIGGQWLAMIVSVLASTVLTLVATAAVMRWCLPRAEQADE